MDKNERRRLVNLIRKLVREVAWEVIDEHLEEYEHKEKPAEVYEAKD